VTWVFSSWRFLACFSFFLSLLSFFIGTFSGIRQRYHTSYRTNFPDPPIGGVHDEFDVCTPLNQLNPAAFL